MNYKKEAGVYILTNTINGKQYIGESLDIRDRMWKHGQANSDQVIHKAIRKYGWDNFSVYVEYLPDFDKDSLINLEEELIKKFNTFHKGYNCSERGSVTRRVITDEFRQKVSQQHKGKKISDKHKQQISTANTGKKRSVSHNEKIAKAHRIKVSQFTLKGDWVADYDSMTEAAVKTGIKVGYISSVCRKRVINGAVHKSTGGYRWKVKE